MTRENTKQLIKKLFIYRSYLRNSNSEQILTDMTNEWFRVLANYDYADVDENLDDFFKEETTKVPDPYQLIRGLKTIEQKNRRSNTYIYCDVCKKPLEVYVNGSKMDRTEADSHMSRCRSVRYLKQIYPKYIGREIDKETEKDLKNMNQYKFDETYYLILKKVHEVMPEGFDKQLLTNVLETG